MTELQQTMQRALDGLVEKSEETGDWARVLAGAVRSGRRSRFVRMAVVAVAAVAVAGAALVVPLDDEQPGVVDQALAAIGDGPVIHVVTRGDWGGSLVDLSTGEVTPMYAEQEVWYDPSRGAHYVSRFADEVMRDGIVPVSRLSRELLGQYAALANRYRDELSAGTAKVVADGSVDGRPVRWIRLRGEWFPSFADGREHLRAEEVAVDASTHEPVYMRWTEDGRPVPGTGQLMLKLETLPAGEGDFTVDQARSRMPGLGGSALRAELTEEELGTALDGKALWLGREHAGKQLVQSRVQEFRSKENKDDEWDIVEGLSLFYGSLKPRRGGISIRDNDKSFVQILQATTLSPMWWGGNLAADVPEGSALIQRNRTGLLRSGGVYVSVVASSLSDLIEALTALRPVSANSPPESSLDPGRIAELVRESRLVRTEGFAPVRPRSLFPRNAKAIQRAEARGVTVTIYESGGARFDTTRMEPAIRRVMPNGLQAQCFKLIRGDRPSNGAYGTVPKNGRRAIPLFAQPQHGRIPTAAGPFDACELGGQLGRDWLPRFDWHWPLEIALTRRGSKYFEERAAAVELGHFVRNGPRKQARSAMKQGAQAPPADALRDPARPYIRVSSSGDRFTAALTASTGHRFFVEIDRGRIGRTNAKTLAFIR